MGSETISRSSRGLNETDFTNVSTEDLHFFFEDRHSSLAAKVSAFSGCFEEDEIDVNTATLDAVKQLAQAGFTAYCVPEKLPGGASVGHPDGLDCRSLTLIRENLGWSSALLDTAFAMQGLGSYPISMVGTEAQKKNPIYLALSRGHVWGHLR